MKLGQNDRKKIFNKINLALKKDERIFFAYVFGSFVESAHFRDIDIGIYLKRSNNKDTLSKELKYADALSKATGISADNFDVKILNHAPYRFINNVFYRGKLLFSRDQLKMEDLMEKVGLDALENESFRHQELIELTS